MKLFIFTATLFFCAQAFASQVPGTPSAQTRIPQATLTKIKTILKTPANDLTIDQTYYLRVESQKLPKKSNTYQKIVRHAIEAERAMAKQIIANRKYNKSK